MENSYIITTWDNELTQFVLDYINKHSFINVRSLRKQYNTDIIIYESKSRSISIKIGIIMKELKKLGIVSNWSRKTYQNHCKGKLFKEMEKKE